VKADARTRARILEAAFRLFGERGLKQVTVRQICQEADANLAAVNYHFGDKLGLYREVLQQAIDAMRETTEVARTAGKGRPPEEQLRRFIGVFLERILGPGGNGVHRLIQREMNEPTPALDALVEQAVRPRIEYLSGVIAALIGCPPGDERVLRCVASVQSQAVAYFPNPITARLGFMKKPTRAHIERTADHIATFSIAGVRAVGREGRST
jgi:TetR/AcrR family transcriptional regulator, regulator of cefoperazone and chloramphenicol sensitivity